MDHRFEATLGALRAIGESTRLRIVTVLRHGELSVTELTDILQQSQPRISRHLRLLVDANVVERHREGNRVFFSLRSTGPGCSILDAALADIDPADPVVIDDLDRLDVVRAERTEAAQAYFSSIAADWDQMRSRHAPDAEVEAAILSIVDRYDYRSLLDVGTGTGRMLALLGGNRTLVRVAGLDTSPAMLSIARANLDAADLRNVELRQGDIHHPPFDPASFDLVVVHQVLHFLDDPDRAVAAVARLVAPGGHLVIVDVATHSLEFLQSAHRRMGFRPDTVTGWMTNRGLTDCTTTEIAPTVSNGLTVLIWSARQPHDSTVPQLSQQKATV